MLVYICISCINDIYMVFICMPAWPKLNSQLLGFKDTVSPEPAHFADSPGPRFLMMDVVFSHISVNMFALSCFCIICYYTPSKSCNNCELLSSM